MQSKTLISSLTKRIKELEEQLEKQQERQENEQDVDKGEENGEFVKKLREKASALTK